MSEFGKMELRWKRVQVPVPAPYPGDTHGVTITRTERVLQYRQWTWKSFTTKKDGRWSPWRDVPDADENDE